MKIALQWVLLALLVCYPIAGAVNILLLGDDNAEGQVQAALEGAGHTVTYAGIYHEWDGVTPAISDFDVVVFLDGYDYGYELQPLAAAALQAFVVQGHRLVMTEWMAWDVCEGYKLLAVPELFSPTASSPAIAPTGPPSSHRPGVLWPITAPPSLGLHGFSGEVSTSATITWRDRSNAAQRVGRCFVSIIGPMRDEEIVTPDSAGRRPKSGQIHRPEMAAISVSESARLYTRVSFIMPVHSWPALLMPPSTTSSAFTATLDWSSSSVYVFLVAFT